MDNYQCQLSTVNYQLPITMIELYLSISKAISKVPGNRWVDLGPRVADHTVAYPATFVQDVSFAPEELGGGQYYGEFTFRVVTYIKPYHASTAKPKSPALSALAVRRAIYDLNDDNVQNTVWLRETVTCDRDGMYAVTQHWKATACVSFAPEILPATMPPKLVLKGNMAMEVS
jgi:hypothetical protein